MKIIIILLISFLLMNCNVPIYEKSEIKNFKIGDTIYVSSNQQKCLAIVEKNDTLRHILLVKRQKTLDSNTFVPNQVYSYYEVLFGK